MQRLWREEGLRVPRRARKRAPAADRPDRSALRASRPDDVWAVDFQFDQTADGRVLKLLNVVDEFTREALAMHVARRIDADELVAGSTRSCLAAARPAVVRCDNGPELTAHALRDWCRFSGTDTAFIEPGAPWQNAYVESFNARVRDELLDVEQFTCLAEARVVIDDWRQDYNHHRPHSALHAHPRRLRRRQQRRRLTPPDGAPRRTDRPPHRLARGLASRQANRPATCLACPPLTHSLSQQVDRRTGSLQEQVNRPRPLAVDLTFALAGVLHQQRDRERCRGRSPASSHGGSRVCPRRTVVRGSA